MNTEHRNMIKFYSEKDLGLYYEFEQSLPILDAFCAETEYDVNQVIELFNIRCILNVIDCPEDFDSERFSGYKNLIPQINKVVGVFFSKITNDCFASILETVDYQYSLDFLKLCELYKVINRVDDDIVKKVLNTKSVLIHELLQCPKWVENFDSTIASYMMSDVKQAEIVIAHHLKARDPNGAVYYLPKLLTPQKRTELVAKYLEYDDVHPNYLYLIKNARNAPEFPISPKMKLQAETVYNAFWKKYFEKNHYIQYGAQSTFADIESVKEEHAEGIVACYTFSKKWVKEHLDYPTLLNNFVFLFDFVDSMLRCSFVSREDMFLTSLLLGGIQGINDYKVGIHFETGRLIANSQMEAYRYELLCNGIDFEDLFDWFYNTYIEQEFGVKGFVFNKPSKNISLLERCRSLCSEMDGVLNQFNLYQQNGEIDRRLLSYSTDAVRISDCKSLQEIKYLYVKEGDFCREANCLLHHDLLYGTSFDLKKYETFASLLIHEMVKLSDFSEGSQKNILWLIKRGSVFVVNDMLRLNVERFLVIKDIYDNGYTTWEHQDANSQSILKEMVDKEELDVGKTLLSIPECEYYNFAMNRTQFQNGWNIRNSLIHGSSNIDVAFLRTAYIEIIKIFVLIVVKINEEFRVKFG